jgi:hypothetical protein
MPGSSTCRPHVLKKQLIVSSHIAAAGDSVTGPPGLAVAKSARELDNSVWFDSQSWYPRSFRVSALGPRSAKLDHTRAIRRKCVCKAELRTSPTNCIQSAARRMHSNSCFRQLTGSDTAHLLEKRVLNSRTASRVLSVVYATDKSEESSKFQRIQS